MNLRKPYIAMLGAFALAGGAHAQEANEDDFEATREELLNEAERAIEELTTQNPIAETLYEEAYGYAVFDTTKGGLIVTGVGGTGIAQPKEGDERIVMHVGGAGVGLGAGLENYLLVLLIQDEETFDEFVSGQWDGAISAQAAAGEAGVAATEQFINGIMAYRMTEGGLMAQVDVTALRFWPSAQWNVEQLAEAD